MARFTKNDLYMVMVYVLLVVGACFIFSGAF